MASVLGQLAVERGWVTPEQVEECLEEQRRSTRDGRPVPLGALLVRRRLISPSQFLELLRAQRALRITCPGCGWSDFSEASIEEDAFLCPKCGARADPDAEPPTPRRIGRYEIESEVARGGMGIVYRGRDPDLGRAVAVKVLRSDGADDPRHAERLAREARAAASLRHPHIVGAIEFGRHEGRHFLAMEFVEGETLDRWLERARPPLDERLAALEKVARAVHYAHGRGVVHRDIKPGNVLMSGGEPHLTDFGLAKRTEADLTMTRPGTMLGTPYYMAPEMVRGEAKQIGPRSDVFALGAILYEMITDARPFEGNSVLDVAQVILTKEPRRPRALRAGLPRDLETICLKALEKEPAARYSSAEGFADDLASFRARRPIRAHPPSTLTRAARVAVRWKGWIVAGALGMVAVAIGIAALIGRSAESVREQARRDVEAVRPVIVDAQRDLWRRGATLEAMDRRLEQAVAELDDIQERFAPVAEAEILKAEALAGMSDATISEALWVRADAAFSRAAALDRDHPALAAARGAFLARRLAVDEVVWALTHGALGRDAPGREEMIATARADLARVVAAGLESSVTTALFETFERMMAGEYEEAEARIDAALEAEDHEELRLLKAHVRLHFSDFAGATAAAARALELRPNYIEAHFIRAAAAFRMLEYDAAEESANELVRLAPRTALARFMRCIVHAVRQQWDDAAVVAREALERSAEEPVQRALAALALILTGAVDEGIAAAREAGAARPEMAGAGAILALGLYESGDAAGANAEMARAAAARPETAAVFAVRAQVEWYQRRDAARAIEFCDFAMEHAPEAAVLYVVRGQVRAESGDVLGGLGDLGRAGRIDPRWNEFVREQIQRYMRERER